MVDHVLRTMNLTNKGLADCFCNETGKFHYPFSNIFNELSSLEMLNPAVCIRDLQILYAWPYLSLKSYPANYSFRV